MSKRQALTISGSELVPVGAQFRNARIVLRDGAEVPYVRAESCLIESVAKHAIYWQGCEFEGCTFTGTYTWNTFGPAEASHGGRFVRCDFSAAIIHDCEFFGIKEGCFAGTRWPAGTVFVRTPQLFWQELAREGWPASIVLETWKVGRVAEYVSYNVKRLASDEGIAEQDLISFCKRSRYCSNCPGPFPDEKRT